MSNGRIIVSHEVAEYLLNLITHPATHEIEQRDLMFERIGSRLNIQCDDKDIVVSIPDINLETASTEGETQEFISELNYQIEHRRQDVLCVGLIGNNLATFSTKYHIDAKFSINVV